MARELFVFTSYDDTARPVFRRQIVRGEKSGVVTSSGRIGTVVNPFASPHCVVVSTSEEQGKIAAAKGATGTIAFDYPSSPNLEEGYWFHLFPRVSDKDTLTALYSLSNHIDFSPDHGISPFVPVLKANDLGDLYLLVNNRPLVEISEKGVEIVAGINCYAKRHLDRGDVHRCGREENRGKPFLELAADVTPSEREIIGQRYALVAHLDFAGNRSSGDIAREFIKTLHEDPMGTRARQFIDLTMEIIPVVSF